MKKINEERTADIAKDWVETDYYQLAETPEWFEGFWSDQSPFYRFFRQLDLDAVVELACGHGRHANRILERVGGITLVDVNPSNIESCRERFGRNPKVSYLVNSGFDLAGVPDRSLSALFCYDAMVHFEPDAVLSYLSEIFRVLRPGGRALLHHSNYDGNPGGDYRENPHMRNFMTSACMRHFSIREGFSVLGAEYLDWGSAAKLDALLLLERPG